MQPTDWQTSMRAQIAALTPEQRVALIQQMQQQQQPKHDSQPEQQSLGLSQRMHPSLLHAQQHQLPNSMNASMLQSHGGGQMNAMTGGIMSQQAGSFMQTQQLPFQQPQQVNQAHLYTMQQQLASNNANPMNQQTHGPPNGLAVDQLMGNLQATQPSSFASPSMATAPPTALQQALRQRQQPSVQVPQSISTFVPRSASLDDLALARQISTPSSVVSEIQQQSKTDMDASSLLHNSCKLYPDTLMVVESALRMDPESIRRRVPILCAGGCDDMGEEPDGRKQQSRKRMTGERYSFPFNIAMKCEATFEILELLATEGPDVLLQKDGPDQASSLAIALNLNQGNEVLQLILSLSPESAQTRDRHANLPLHTLVRSPCVSLDRVKLVYRAYPDALKAENFDKETPLDVAVRTGLCPEGVVNFFQNKAFGKLEEQANHLDDLVDNI